MATKRSRTALPLLEIYCLSHVQGWRCIDSCLGEYTGVRALWLEGNGLTEIQHLDNLVELRCLYIQQNCLQSLAGLDKNVDLDAINATNNSIKSISDISHLTR